MSSPLPKQFCAVLAAFAVMLSIANAGSTYEPWPWDSIVTPVPKRQWPPGPTRDYLGNLRRPDPYQHDNAPLCCDEGETVDTKFKVDPGEGPHPEDRWCAWLDGKWVRVPPDKIVSDYAPDGRAYVFVMYGVIQCFVRPRGGL
jgi:hypothetical protein